MPLEVAIIFMLALLTFRLLTTVIHELGHAIPALILTKEKVTVYMGSYGDPKKSIHFQVGRLECFFKFNLFYWNGGLCVMHDKKISVRTSFIVTIFGPLLSLIVAGIALLCLNIYDFDIVTQLIVFALIFSCVLDFLNNIFPKRDTIKLHDGTFTNNDGKHLLNLLKYKESYRKIQTGTHHLENSNFKEAAATFEDALSLENNLETFYRLAIYANLMQKDYTKAQRLQEAFTARYEAIFNANDYCNWGIILLHFNEYDKAISINSKAINEMPYNISLLNNRGYTYGLIQKHEEAIVDLDKVIMLDAKHAYAWNNRGYSKLQLGQLEDGLQDIQQSLTLNAENSYAYRNVGLYHFYKKEYQKALEWYQKANDIDPKTLFLQDYIEEVHQHL